MNPAMKSGNVYKARRSFDKFDAEWDNIEDLVKVRSREAYDTIEQQTDRVAGALKQPTPDVDRVTSLVSGIMDEYTNRHAGDPRSQGQAESQLRRSTRRGGPHRAASEFTSQ